MPTYDYHCAKCTKTFEVVKRLAELDREEPCPLCNAPAERQISRPMVAGDYAPYRCPITGREIRGRREHEENLKRHDCRVYEAGETEQFIRSKQQRQKALEREVDACLEQTASEIGLGG